MGRWLPIWLRQPNWPGPMYRYLPLPVARCSSCVWLVACTATFVFQPRLSCPSVSGQIRSVPQVQDDEPEHGPYKVRETVAGARDVVSLAGH